MAFKIVEKIVTPPILKVQMLAATTAPTVATVTLTLYMEKSVMVPLAALRTVSCHVETELFNLARNVMKGPIMERVIVSALQTAPA